MQRGLNLDVLGCPKCHHRMTVIGQVTEREVAEKILTHLNLPLRPEQEQDRLPLVEVTGQSFEAVEAMAYEQLARAPP